MEDLEWKLRFASLDVIGAKIKAGDVSGASSRFLTLQDRRQYLRERHGLARR